MGEAHAELPEYVQIEPVGQCNLRCRMCAIQFRKDGTPHGPAAFMEFDVFTRIVDGMSRMNALHLQGLGEPLLHPRFFDMVAYAAAKGVRVSTSSNLTLLGVRRAERCVDSGLAELHVSLDGATAATYEAIRLHARYARVVANLERLVAARRARAKDAPKIVVVFVAMRRNVLELPQLVLQAARWGVDELFVQHLCHGFDESTLPSEYAPMREFIGEEMISERDTTLTARVFDAARERAASLGLALRLPRLVPKPEPGCEWPRHGAYVSYDGLAMPCCMIGTPDRLNFGSMADDGVEAVWNGAAYAAFRARLERGDPHEICRSCSLYHGTF